MRLVSANRSEEFEQVASATYAAIAAGLPDASGDPAELPALRRAIGRAIGALGASLPPGIEREALLDRLVVEHAGLGPLDIPLADPEITGILVPRWDRLWVERNGRWERTPLAFRDEAALRVALERLGRRARYDGSHLTVLTPPAVADGLTAAIRRPTRRFIPLIDLIRSGALTDAMAEILRATLPTRANLLLSGPPGAGKTTLLNALLALAGAEERVVTVEDAPELQPHTQHWIRLQALPDDGPSARAALLRAALQMRPDRLVAGNVGAGEAFELLAAAQAGWKGIMAAVRAGSSRAALSRLAIVAAMSAPGITPQIAREMVAGAFTLLAHMTVLPDGRRVVAEIAEITGYQGDAVQTQTLFTYNSGKGGHEWAGVAPQFLEADPTAPPLPAFSRLRQAQRR